MGPVRMLAKCSGVRRLCETTAAAPALKGWRALQTGNPKELLRFANLCGRISLALLLEKPAPANTGARTHTRTRTEGCTHNHSSPCQPLPASCLHPPAPLQGIWPRALPRWTATANGSRGLQPRLLDHLIKSLFNTSP